MSGAARVLVTGATGRIGGHLVRVLSERGVAVRALSRDPSRGEPLPGVAWVAGDLAEPRSLGGAFEGVERLFLLTGNGEDMVRLQKNALRAAREAGVLSYRDATQILAEATGRGLRFEPETPEEARARLTTEGLPDPLIAAQLAIAAYQRQGGPTEKTTDAVEQLLGRPPRTFRDFARDHATELTPSQAAS